jgi:demethylspheroidene O-methyltransferase
VPARPAWRDRLDRVLASPRFQRWAAGFPLTRPVARRRAQALFDLCAGFVYAQILAACVQLDLFERLRDGPMALPALARALDLPVPAAARLLDAAVALRLVGKRRGGYGLGPLGAALLGNPAVVAMIAHHDRLYADLADPVALLRGTAGPTALGAYWPYAGAATPTEATPAAVAPYSALMAQSQAFIADEVLDAYDFGRHRCLLDVGGGEGAFATALAARAPALRLILFDLPAVAERASARFAAAGLAARATAVGGDFHAGGLPHGADVVSLVRVLHDHDDAAALAILRAARAALPPDGTLLIAEPLSDTPGAARMGDAYFGFYLLAMGSGRPRDLPTLTAMLAQAGFGAPRECRTRRPFLTRLLVAHPLRDAADNLTER